MYSKFTELYNYHHNPILKHFYHALNISQANLESFPICTSSHRQALIYFFFIDLPFLAIVCKWYHKVAMLAHCYKLKKNILMEFSCIASKFQSTPYFWVLSHTYSPYSSMVSFFTRGLWSTNTLFFSMRHESSFTVFQLAIQFLQ